MTTRRRKAEAIRTLLETEGETVYENANIWNTNRYDVLADFDRYEELRTQARSIKEEAISNLPALIEQVETAVEANGGQVHRAMDDDEAADIVGSITTAEEAKTVVKSKSMTTEEIDLNEHLEEIGVEVYETDLGEFVIQVANEAPSHLVGPALHKSTEEIATLFNGAFELDEPLETPEELTMFARDQVGEYIREADVGITGANFVLADSGTITLVTNEGNARKTAVTPPVHIAVAGIEKLLPSIDELQPFVELIGKTATGQEIPQYISMLTPPVESPTMDFESEQRNFGGETPIGESGATDREFHLVLVDNGRSAMRDDPDLRETLYCIRCGACANSCANFQHVGGHGFGGETYTGGIATGWEAGVEGAEATADFNDLCTGCSRCVSACPVKIDIPWVNVAVRDRLNRGRDPSAFDHLVTGLTPDEEPTGIDPQKRVFGNFETLARWGSRTAPISNWTLQSTAMRWLLERLAGVDRRRSLPQFRRRTLTDWFDSRSSQSDGTQGTVALYPDVYTNFVQIESGQAAVRVLESLGFDVELGPVIESGRAPLSQGMIETARSKASELADAYLDIADSGQDIVVIEPSDIAMIDREYGRLLDESTHHALNGASSEIMEFVFDQLAEGGDRAQLSEGSAKLAYHSHCQQRTLGLEAPTEAVLSDLGYDVMTSSVECCGMAGSFGYKSEYYELSMDVGRPLAEEFGDSDRRIVASGTSCLEQLDALLDSDPVHPIEVIDPETN